MTGSISFDAALNLDKKVEIAGVTGNFWPATNNCCTAG